MHRIDHATADVTDPSKPKFTGGNPGTGVPATVVTAAWLNAVQGELANFIESQGIALDEENNNQLEAAIISMIAASAHAVIIGQATFEATVADGDAVRWNSAAGSFAKAVADGTASNRAVGIADVTNSEVTAFGETRAGLMSGLTPGGQYYLSAAAAGGLVTSMPEDRVKIGTAKASDVLFVDIDAAAARDPYDIPFIAGYASDGTGKDLAVQLYGEVTLTRAIEIEGEVASLGLAATGAALIFDVEKNGVSIYSTKPQFADGAVVLTPGVLTSAPDPIAFAAGDKVTLKVTQVGSTVAGQQLTVGIKGRAV